MGSTLFAFIGGMFHWFPKMFGKMYNEFWGIAGSTIAAIGFNVTFFPQFVAGAHGMPRRYASYPDVFQGYHVVSTIGAYILTLGLFIILFTWLWGIFKGRTAPANPWGGNTLEWHASSPPAPHNFEGKVPEQGDPYDFHAWEYDENEKGYVYNENAKPVSHH